MKTIWKLFVGDIRRITSNVVSIIIVIGLVVIPGIFTWFNVAASWDPFANTGNLKFAVANEDDGYRSDLIPVKINIGDQVVNTLRSNDQLDWTFTTKKEAINGTKSGKYYAAVVIPKNFSTRMMTFFASDGNHAEIAYYNNEKKNALAPKITGQGADTVSAQVNETFSETLTSTALSVASQLANQLDKPAAQEQLTQFNGNISDFAETLTDASGTLRTFSTLTQSARHLLESSDGLIANVSGNAKSVGTTLKQAGSGVEDLTGALKTGTTALGTALTDSANSFTAMEADVDSLFGNAGTQAGNTANALRNQATNISKQAQSYQQIYDSLDALSANEKLPEAVRNAIDHLKTNVGTTITQLNDLASALNGSADNIDAKVSDTTAERAQRPGSRSPPGCRSGRSADACGCPPGAAGCRHLLFLPSAHHSSSFCNLFQYNRFCAISQSTVETLSVKPYGFASSAAGQVLNFSLHLDFCPEAHIIRVGNEMSVLKEFMPKAKPPGIRSTGGLLLVFAALAYLAVDPAAKVVGNYLRCNGLNQ